MRRCTKCGHAKTESEFGKNKNMSDGLNVWCKECACKGSSNYRANNREKYLESSRAYKKSNRSRTNLWTKLWKANNADRVREDNLLFRARHPNSHNAEEKVRRRIQSGEIVVPTKCGRCGKGERLHAHHHNGYAPPHELDVTFLCQSCHQLEHRRQKAV